jgi:hypothetical protein
MSYFSSIFSKTTYNFKGKVLPIIDFLTTFSIKREVRESPEYFSLHRWTDADRIDRLANKTYADPYEFWAIAKANNFVDVLSDAPKTTANLNSWANSLYPGSAWFVGPTPTLSAGLDPMYSPGIDTNERPALVHGQDVIFGDFEANTKDTFIVVTNNEITIPDRTKIFIDSTTDKYPTLPQKTTLEKNGIPWYIPGFMPNVGTAILYKNQSTPWPPEITESPVKVNFEEILSGDNLDLTGYYALRVTAVDKKLKLFWVEALDGHTPPLGSELFDYLKAHSDIVLHLKLMSMANVYHQDQTLGRLLVTFAPNTAQLKIKKPINGNITGVPAIVVSDLNRADPINKDGLLNIRKFFVYKVVTTAIEALDTFGDNTTGRMVGTSASPQKGVRADTLSYLCRYVTGFYGGLPNNISVITIYDSLQIINRKKSIIKLPSEGVLRKLRQSLSES